MKVTDTATPRKKAGRPRVIHGAKRHLGFDCPAELADRLDALLPRTGQRSAAMREALELVLQKHAAQAPVQEQAPNP